MVKEKMNYLEAISKNFDVQKFKRLHEEMTLSEYIEKVYENPRLIRTAYQRLYDMITKAGTTQIKRYRKTITKYNFFDDKEIPIFGLEETLENIVKFVRGAAGGYGTEKRIMLLHGPVGSAKSTICRLIKRGMEKYSLNDDGAWYTFKWVGLPTGQNGIYTQAEDECPMHEEPLKLIPVQQREKVLAELNQIFLSKLPPELRTEAYTLKCEGELDPRCKKFFEELLVKYQGDWQAVMENHIRVVRKVYSESERMGVATFQPKDEKNQDSTELTGDINYAKLPHFGSDSDPRAFNFDGEFCVGNRGVVEFIEILKLAREFLYDLLGATQERQIKPKKFAQIAVDEVLMGHTNNPEYEKLCTDNTMEAFRDRTVRIDVPYLLRWSDEVKVLQQDYNPSKVKQHVAPHTLEIAALFAVLTRLQDDKDGNLSLVDKAKLYDGRQLAGWTEDRVKELRDKYPDEGMKYGVSARYIQDKISNCLSAHHEYINQFMVMNELRDGLDHSSLLTNKEDRARYLACVDLAIKELDEILKAEVQKALVGDENAITRLCTQYIDNMMAYIEKTKIIDPYTQREMEPDERLMRSIEEKIGIVEQHADDFRRSLASFIAGLAHRKEVFRWDSNAKLKKALEKKLFEDTKDHIKLSALHAKGAGVVDKTLQEKIDAVKQRMIDWFGYNQQSATDALNHVSAIFSRGDQVED